MKTADASILIVPGFGNSGEDHWQSRWEKRLSTARRVIQPDWHRADRAQWAGAIEEAVRAAEKPVILVAHSLAVAAVVQATARFLPGKTRGAFLVSMPDCSRADLLPGHSHDFAPIPRDPLPFPSVLVASRTDPYCDYETAADHANAWGSMLIDAGDSGHINAESGHGPWPEGLMSFAGFMARL